MSLSLYKEKRNFSETPEPEGKEKPDKKALRFVVQKHDASALHYDFRLEMEGVLKSWAVPKGPSLNPQDKRLAMMVEDHPYDYRTFEGVIPDNNYGAGTVIVWDEGTYVPADAEGLPKKKQEELLLKALENGSLKFILHGKKLKGVFTLFQLKRDKEGKTWLLVKKKDEYATEEDITQQNASVTSGKTLAQVAKENNTTLNHPEEEIAPAKPSKQTKKKAIAKKAKQVAEETITRNTAGTPTGPGKENGNPEKHLGASAPLATKKTMPGKIKPMMATLTNEPFDHPDWLFEIKWDGYRAVAYCENDKVEIISRNEKPFTEKYSPVTEALQELRLRAVLDGEVVAVDEKGLANFQLLQNWQNTPQTRLQYFAFDILWLNDNDITALPLIERKRMLQALLPQNHEVIKYSDHVVESGNDFFKVALKQGLEGIMAKNCNSTYKAGNRTEDWLKIKVAQRQEVVIAGFTQPRNSRLFFGALLLGVYDKDELVYIGHTGSGFNRKSLEQIWKRLQLLIIGHCPFKECPRGNMPVTWVQPQLVCEIKFTEWTKERIARHPIFMGLREDKKAKEVTFEKSKTTTSMTKKATTQKNNAREKKAHNKKGITVPETTQKSSTKTSGLQLMLEEGTDQTIILNGHELTLTNLDKLYWKKEKGSKLNLINYYLKAAPYLLPYMLDRPQSLHRYPNGIDAPHFYQKDVKGKVPDWMPLQEDFSESTNEKVHYLVCSNEATLIYMANLGCIEMHPWHSRIQAPYKPDYCLIDLDPEDIHFDKVIECAQVVKKVLDAAGAEGCVKTSGSTGIHIYIPLGAKYDYEQSRQFAELIVTMVHQEIPDYTSLERNPKKRKGKVYLDFLQNSETQTAAAPYSLRPKPGMPVSTPLHWDEVKKGLTPHAYHIHNIFDRLKTEGDLFKPVLGKGIYLEKAVQKMQALIS